MADFEVTYTLEDAYQRVGTKRYDFSAADHPTALTAALAMADDLAALTEMRILWYVVHTRVAYSDSVTAGANKDEGITLVVRTTDNEKAVLKVPGPMNAVINADGTVDITNALVSDYVDNFITGDFTVSDGEDVTELLSGRLDK